MFRSTYANKGERARETLEKEGIDNFIVLVSIGVKEVRDIYRAAWAVLIISNTDVHPAGLTCLTEALSCGATVAIPEGQSQEGYVGNGEDAITFPEISTDAVISVMKTFKDDSFGNGLRVPQERGRLFS